MDSRAPKRRKVSGLASTTTRAKSSPITHNKRTSRTTESSPGAKREQLAAAQTLSEGPSPKGVWRQAKEKVHAQRYAKKVDVYDDYEGAHDPSKTRGERGGRSRELAETKSAKKPALDPLRNQKMAEVKSPRKSGTTLGLFKQFAADPARGERVYDFGKKADEALSCLPIKEGDDSEDELAPRQHSSSPPKTTEKVKPSWHYEPASSGASSVAVQNSPSRKTFEDEIKELEEKARNEVKKDEGEGEGPAKNTTRRTSTRNAAQQTPVTTPTVKSNPAPGSTTKLATRSLDRRKAGGSPRKTPQIEKDTDEGLMEDDVSTPEITAPPAQLAPSSRVVKPRSARKRTAAPATTFQASHLQCIQKVLLEKATGKRLTPLINLNDEYAKVSTLVNQTVAAGESNSMLLIGARGSGKSALVNHILRKQALEHPDDFHVVRLSGFIHTDDKIALREIWRQLGREMELDEEESTTKNFADTLTTLLALLSHPAENGLQTAPNRMTKSVIFVIDEFELFATHPRQTLLYNLFDIAQSRKAPIAVLGLTTRIDVAESLEKRVKSRFSHRYEHLSLAESFPAFKQICMAALAISHEELTENELQSKELTSATHVQTSGGSSQSKPDAALFLNDWNALAEDLLSTETIEGHIRRLYYTTKSIPDFLTTMLVLGAAMPVTAPTSSTNVLEHFTSTFASSILHPPNSKLDLLPSLSTLQLALLICGARQTAIHSTEVVSFALAYEEYKVLASKAKLQASASGSIAQGAGSRVWSKDIARTAWQDLIGYGLVMEDGRAGGTGRVDVGLEEIGMSGVELGPWGRWCREI